MRTGFVKDPNRRRGVHLIPNLLTTGNLFSGLASIVASFHAMYEAAAIAILIALIFDTLDGSSARLMKSTSQFGVEYDSLADLVSFGVAPGLLMYSWALKSPGMFLGEAVMFAFVACGALRLARYNTMVSTGENKFFTGLPIPGAAGVLATFVIFDHHVLEMTTQVRPVVVLMMSLGLAFLMVSTVRYWSFKDLKFRGHHHFNYLVWAILIFMLVIARPQFMLFVVFALYTISGPTERVTSELVKLFRKRSEPTTPQPESTKE